MLPLSFLMIQHTMDVGNKIFHIIIITGYCIVIVDIVKKSGPKLFWGFVHFGFRIRIRVHIGDRVRVSLGGSFGGRGAVLAWACYPT